MKRLEIGARYGLLTVLRLGPPGTQKKKRRWVCRCDCGNEVTRRVSELTGGRAYSCGCVKREHIGPRKTKEGALSGTRSGRTWYMMMERCYNPKDVNYANYGGRGIVVCEEWRQSLRQFCLDMGERPEGMSIDRIDNDGPYSKDNCRWATAAEQRRNTRRTIRVEWEGSLWLLVDLCLELNLSYSMIRARLRAGWPLGKAVSEPVRRTARKSVKIAT